LDAQNEVGLRLLLGRGVPEDRAEAANWFRKAAEMDYPPSQYNLGLCYEKGLGIPEDLDEAKRRYGLSAARGFEKAIERLRLLDERTD
jgi:TPR repeat protein